MNGQPRSGCERKRELKNLSMKEEMGIEMNEKEEMRGMLDRLVHRLEELEVEARDIRHILKEVIKGIRKEEREGTAESKKPTSRKNGSWRVGDHIIVKNAFRYRGGTDKQYGTQGIVTKVTEDWIWFKVLRSWKSDEIWEDGYYRKRRNLRNKEWN